MQLILGAVDSSGQNKDENGSWESDASWLQTGLGSGLWVEAVGQSRHKKDRIHSGVVEMKGRKQYHEL